MITDQQFAQITEPLRIAIQREEAAHVARVGPLRAALATIYQIRAEINRPTGEAAGSSERTRPIGGGLYVDQPVEGPGYGEHPADGVG